MFQGLDPATGEQRCAPLWRADPRSKLAAGPLLAAPSRPAVAAARPTNRPGDSPRPEKYSSRLRAIWSSQ